jgi:hypothetical protein
MAEKNILSKPFSVTLANTTGGRTPSRYIFYTEVQGRQQGNNFLPKEGASSAEINVFRKISELEYQALELRGSNLIKRVPATEAGGRDLFLANDAIIVNNEIFPTQIAPDNVQRFSSDLKNQIIQTGQSAIADSNLNNNSNISPNTAPQQNQITTSTPVNVPISQPDVEFVSNNIKTYPINMSPFQDRMEFTVWKYKNRGNTNAASVNILSLGSPEYERVDAGFVYLPVTKISDTNSVNWQEDGLNELQKGLANLSLEFMKSGGTGKPVDQAKDLLKMTQSGQFGNLARLYLAGQAVSVNNLLTKATGAILNPNLELLFNGPVLRQFGFGFDLLSKSKNEAKIIKEIIKFFKQNMAVRDSEGAAGISEGIEGRSAKNLFLNSPYVFRIKYLSGSTGDNENAPDHKSIGKIKMCALQSCTVDYTPMGTYMTFNDPEKTFPMFMYRITLQFKELTPIYSSDYSASHDIGF